VNWSAEVGAEGPAGVVTTTCTEPVPAGEVAVIDVSLWTVTLVAGVEPKRTAVAPVRLVPVMVTLVPPAAGPEAGVIAVTAGFTGTESACADGESTPDATTGINNAATATHALQRHRGWTRRKCAPLGRDRCPRLMPPPSLPRGATEPERSVEHETRSHEGVNGNGSEDDGDGHEWPVRRTLMITA
jgi:hypothetical protein